MPKPAIVLLTAPLVLYLLLHVFVVPMHLGDLAWPDHAKHHALRSAFQGAALAGLGIWIALGPLRRQRTWALKALLLVGGAAYGGFWISTASVAYGAEGLDLYGSLAHESVQTLLFFLGLALAWRGPRGRS